MTEKTRSNLRPVLWLVLAVSLAGNVVMQASPGLLLVGIGLGAVAVASGVWLIVDHYRHR
jgi:hypothetical protein